jgi:hypothetical protein
MRWSIRLFILCCGMALLGACRAITVDGQFDDESRQLAIAQLKPGRSVIAGEAFMRRMSGRPVTASGERMLLFPATPYADRWFRSVFGGRHFNSLYFDVIPTNTDAEFVRLARQTKTDMSGKFYFTDLRPGRYWLITRVTWYEPGYYFPSGGVIADEIIVPEKGTVDYILSEF